MDPRAVLLVVGAVGLFAVVGLISTVWLIARGVDPAAVAVVGTPTAAALGSLTTLLAVLFATHHPKENPHD